MESKKRHFYVIFSPVLSFLPLRWRTKVLKVDKVQNCLNKMIWHISNHYWNPISIPVQPRWSAGALKTLSGRTVSFRRCFQRLTKSVFSSDGWAERPCGLVSMTQPDSVLFKLIPPVNLSKDNCSSLAAPQVGPHPAGVQMLCQKLAPLNPHCAH